MAWFEIRLRHSWTWLVGRGQLLALPDEDYNPVRDARRHLTEHQRRACLACGVWEMLRYLWSLTEDLYHRRHLASLRAASRKLQKALEQWSAAVGAGREQLVADGLAERLAPVETLLQPALPSDLGHFGDAVLEPYSADAQFIVTTGRRTQVAKRVCVRLKRAGFSYAEIAMLIGLEGEGAVERVRGRGRY